MSSGLEDVDNAAGEDAFVAVQRRRHEGLAHGLRGFKDDLVPEVLRTRLFSQAPSPPLGFRPSKSGRSAPNSPHVLLAAFSLMGTDGPKTTRRAKNIRR